MIVSVVYWAKVMAVFKFSQNGFPSLIVGIPPHRIPYSRFCSFKKHSSSLAKSCKVCILCSVHVQYAVIAQHAMLDLFTDKSSMYGRTRLCHYGFDIAL